MKPITFSLILIVSATTKKIKLSNNTIEYLMNIIIIIVIVTIIITAKYRGLVYHDWTKYMSNYHVITYLATLIVDQ